jgi:hypothetical protein
MSSFYNVILSRGEEGNKITFFLDYLLFGSVRNREILENTIYESAWYETNCSVNGFKIENIEFVIPIFSESEDSKDLIDELESFLKSFAEKSKISRHTISFGMMLISPEEGENAKRKNEVIANQIEMIAGKKLT